MFERKCPQCNKTCSYTRKGNRDQAEKKKLICGSCAQKTRIGERNSFYGHKHTQETKDKAIAWNKQNEYKFKCKAFKDKMSKKTSGKNNPMYNRSCYEVWLSKYGEDEANRRSTELNQKRSKNATGSNNPMYGKPSPKGSGCGWSGWYKGWYFRSLRELSYMINVIEPNNHQWISAERSELSIPYVDTQGRARTYRADFLLDGLVLVEIKPQKLMTTHLNHLKMIAAERFCSERCLEYRLTDASLLDYETLLQLYKEGLVELLPKYQRRLEKRRGNRRR